MSIGSFPSNPFGQFGSYLQNFGRGFQQQQLPPPMPPQAMPPQAMPGQFPPTGGGGMGGFGQGMMQSALQSAQNAFAPARAGAGAPAGGDGGMPYGSPRPGPTGANIPMPGQVPGSVPGATNPVGQAFEDPQAAVWNALKNMGVNVYSSDPMIQHILSKASDLINQNVMPAIANGVVSPADMAGIGKLVQQAVQNFATNQPVFFGGGMGGGGRGILDQLLALGHASEGGSPTEGGSFIASILDNPQAAAALGQSLLYGGATGSTAAKVLGRPIAALPAELQRQQFYTPGGLPLAGVPGYMSILERYLNGQLQPFSGQ